jgi:hypothetical protein
MHKGFWLKKPGRKLLLGMPRRRWDNDIKMRLRERGWNGMDLIYFAQNTDEQWAVLNMAMNLRVP